MTYRLAYNARNAAADAICTLLNGGYIKIFSGPQPNDVNGNDTGTELVSLAFGSTAFQSASYGTASAYTINSANVNNSGTAEHFRLKLSNGDIHSDGTCGTSNAELVFDNTSLVAGGQVSISSFTLTVPE